MNYKVSTVTVGKANIHSVTVAEVLALIDECIKMNSSPRYIVTPNVDHVVQLENDTFFQKIYEEAYLVLADGVPVIWASRFLNSPIKEKISGSDLFPILCHHSAQKRYKLFFLGGKRENAILAVKNLEKKYPHINIVGYDSPALGFESDQTECQSIIENINEAKPDILLLFLGTPKQEKWLYTHRLRLNVPISLGLGAALDFESGMIQRAPKIFQNIGLEWLWRLLHEPKRLWRRYLIEDPYFFVIILKQKYIQTFKAREEKG